MNQNITRTLGRSKLLLQKHSPEILLGAGIAGTILATILACKASTKAEELAMQNEQDMMAGLENIQKALEVGNANYSADDARKDAIILRVREYMTWVRLYGPAAGMYILSIASILMSHGIMKNRATALMAAYAVLQEGFTKYRERVVDELGEDQDRHFRFGTKDIKIKEDVTDPVTGKTKKVTTTKQSVDPSDFSDYAKFFDEMSIYWESDPAANLTFLKLQEQYANDKLRSQGHLFLSEVYDALGIPRTPDSIITGWVLDGHNGGDQRVDFGIYNVVNAAFVNNWEDVALLDFNVDGVIWELI